MMDVNTENYRIPPSAVDIEKIVLCSFFVDAKTFTEYAHIISDKYFYKSEHREIFKYMWENNTADSVLVNNKFPQHAEIMSNIYESSSGVNLMPYIDILKDRYMRRELISICSEAENKSFDEYEYNAEDIKCSLTDKISELISFRKMNQPEKIGKIIPRVFEHIEKIKTGGHGYINTGLTNIDEIIGVFSPGELIIIAARPGMGKSSLAANIIRHNSIRKKIPTLLFSLEMDKVLSSGRIVFAESEASYDNAMKNRLSQSDIRSIELKAEEILDAPIIIDETPAITLQEIISKTLWHKQNSYIGLVVIDHLHLVGFKRAGRSRNEEIGVLSAGLKTLARTIDCPVIALSQLSREVERRRPPRPMLSDLRDSGNIEQDADKVIMLYREEKYYPEKTDVRGICEVIVAKNRNGPDGYREVCFNDKTMNFYNKADEAGF